MTTPDATPNQLVTRSRTIDSDTIRLYAELCNDFNPIHVDEAFAAKTPFGRPIAHGTLTLALVWEAFDHTFGCDVLAGAEVEIKFARPVLVDTHVTAAGIRVDGPHGDVWEIDVKNGDGIVVLMGTVKLLAAHQQPSTE